MSGTSSFFDSRAPVYDALRPQDGAWWRRYEALVRHGDLRGRRVLDIGCGTGALAVALAERELARVWGVEPSPEMLAVARSRGVRGVGLKAGRAEELPFKDGWFDRTVMCLVAHLVDRPRAFAEARRVLGPQGLHVIATFDHAHFERHWAAPYFPSLPVVDRKRFPTRDQLEHELAAAGFAAVSVERLDDVTTIDRHTALEKLRAGHISTFALLDPGEVREGIERAARGLPEQVEVRLEQLIVVATR